MQIPGVNGLQQVTETVPLPYGPNYQLALLDGNVDCRACGYLRLGGE
jgi:hypothetical protein